MIIPEYALKAIKKLEENGYEAYLVGGCVRDFIIGIVPHDFDITTNALPEQIKTVFSGNNIVTDGEKHGTVTVIADHPPLEITTYRIEGKYTDSRHPDNVQFSSSLNEDLKRRDFTINAIAMDKNGNIVDISSGRSDIKNRIIKTVGKAEDRFSEDALRILRALRFAARFGFDLEEKTAAAVHKLKHTLNNISIERINAEFTGILCGKYAEKILREYRDVIAVFIPEILPCFDFKQNSPYHKYDVWEHTLHAVGACADKKNVKLAVFFHDIAKPLCYTQDNTGRGHFKGHSQKGAEITHRVMKRLKYPNKDIKAVTTLIYHHSDPLDSLYEIKKLMGQIDYQSMIDLLDVQRADSLSKQDFCRERLKKTDAQEQAVRKIIENHECVSVKELDINGNELIKLGFQGVQIKLVLLELLDNVIKSELPNKHDSLVNYAESIMRHRTGTC